MGANRNTGGTGTGKTVGAQWNGTRVVDNGVCGIIGHVGQPGSGKSFEMARTVQGCSRVAVFDAKMTYGTGRRQNRLPGFTVVHQPHQLKAIIRRAGRGGFRVIYQPPRLLSYNEMEGRGKKGEREIDNHFRAFLVLLMGAEDVVIAVDEIWLFCEPGWMPGPLQELSRASRHYGATLLYTAQRPQLVSTDLRDNTDQWRVFRLQGLAVDALQGRVVPAALAEVERLPDRVHIRTDAAGNWQRVGG